MVQNIDNLSMEITLILIKRKSHLREISRSLNESHSTIHRKLANLKKENILDSKTEGKNKIFFLKDTLKAKSLVYSAELYKLIKTIGKYPELEIILNEIKKNSDEKMIILFGSYAKGNAEKSSDIDIYIETSNSKIMPQIEQINSKISVKIGGFNKNSPLIKEIIKDHVILRGFERFYEKAGIFELN